MKSFFVAKDGRANAEPILVVITFVLDVWIGKNSFTTWFGWWLFLSVITCVPAHINSYILRHNIGKERFKEEYPNAHEWLTSHKTFMFFVYYSIYLHFWWKWL